ncbi:PIH1 domain-containing protein 1 [Tribolium castaneum]|uniref:PIH1 domain-containing protein 1 n=1 Tax=Tribolium castaneum TaxID=7070 RepID=UPI0000D56EF6|nr:PREDICTED: PIH1 domain-containing protein 1 [Tribolium castaneum]|eukprot:XP_008197333.1 PREDICTED: PIH1 domain-containing protein 1 [Tribolium castaneum]
MTKSSGVFLDVDPTIVENNLRFATDANEEEFNKIFNPPGEQFPSKLVKPFPGFCIKTHEIGSDTKFFVNICHTDAIPAPKDISENELKDILNSDDAPNFRVPMSIGEIRNDKDKKGEDAKACDVAIHPTFFKKVEQSQLFKSFFVTIVFEGLKDKYGIICKDEKIILQNRKAFGNLQVHRVQQREIDEKMRSAKSPIEELRGNNEAPRGKPLIETISSNEMKCREPEYRLFRRKAKPNCLIGEFKFPDIISAKELTLDIGEDRIVIESTSKHYLLDVFVPLVIRQASCTSTFSKATKVLTVTMPLVGG